MNRETFILASGEVFYYTPSRTPTLSAPSTQSWRAVTVEEQRLAMVEPSQVRAAVEKWVEQLVRRQLGGKFKGPLKISIDHKTAEAIYRAQKKGARR